MSAFCANIHAHNNNMYKNSIVLLFIVSLNLKNTYKKAQVKHLYNAYNLCLKYITNQLVNLFVI